MTTSGTVNTIGKNKLGVMSEGMSSQATNSVTFNIPALESRWQKVIDKYKRPVFVVQAGVMK